MTRSTLKQIFGGVVVLLSGLAMGLTGCDQQQQEEEKKVFDLEAPGVDIEVRESKDGERNSVDIETGPDAEGESSPPSPN